ncbi:hypothetical protein K7X08_014074 [Anisodus acutangulus]|uniref:Peptidylprolyl isomerase n=1 Tax=Anisodus acutangulus TaxID=402998 RepID=A0A9Q1LLE1_9SOLA|nr:hypothetical protein K7X08_014074 [Anisodus acutangulus]
MLRVSSLHVAPSSPIGTPTVNLAFKFLKITWPLNPTTRKVLTFTRLALLNSSTLLPSLGNIQFPSFNRVLPMMGCQSCLRLITASYSAGGSSGVGREILVQHLLVKEDDQKLLLELQKRTREGEDLSDLAIEYSICPSKEDGGMLGWVRKGQMVPEFEEAAFSAPLNKVVGCKTKFGWHLLQVLSEREESVLEHIQPNEFHVRLQDPSFLEEAQLIDVREPEEVAQASLPGFQVLPLRQFGSWGPEITTKFDPQKDTYVLCHHGMRSLQVAKWLQTQGFRKIFNVAGGIHEYAVKVDPSIPTY